VIERWRRWTWKKYESRISVSDNFAEFERLFSGPLTPDLASRMPGELLLERRGKVDQGTRKIIDSEMMRRLNSRQPVITNLISAAALIISLIALAKAW
jgi:hypothetical protein